MVFENTTVVLILTALSLGVVHTLMGPDHYIPFIALAKARRWSLAKTSWITFFCAIGHVGSSVAIGLAGILLGKAIPDLEWLEEGRGEIASWLLLSFGFLYMVWGIRKAWRGETHSHSHVHSDGSVHLHSHDHTKSHHVHVHDEASEKKKITAWVLFIIFVFGPCEPLIPILLYPAAAQNLFALISVIVAFFLTTTLTMIGVTLLSLRGISFLPIEEKHLDRYAHAASGALVFLSGVGVVFFGL